MKNWNAIQKELEKGACSVPASDPSAFWSEFEARARLMIQDAPSRPRHPVLWTSMALAGAAAVLALVLVWPGATWAATRVTALEVEAVSHNAAMILNVTSEDGKEAGALVWVAGLPEENP